MSISKNQSLTVLVLLFATFSSASTLGKEDSTKSDSFWSKIKLFSIDITATESAYSSSWVGGEASSASWVANCNIVFASPLFEDLEVRSRFKFSFGQTYTQNLETKVWNKPIKSTDLIDLDNVFSRPIDWLIDWPVDPYLAQRIETQFYDGSNPRKKLPLSPVKFTESFGVTRTFYKKDKKLVVSRLGFAIRQTITKTITDTIALTHELLTTNNRGIESVSEVDLPLHKHVRYNGKLSLFKSLYDSKSYDLKGTEFENDWKAVELNFENGFIGKVTKHITFNLYLQFLYDKRISRQVRIKQTLALGLVYKPK